MSHRAKDFLSHLLVTDARERYTVKQVLRHPFLSLDVGLSQFRSLFTTYLCNEVGMRLDCFLLFS